MEDVTSTSRSLYEEALHLSFRTILASIDRGTLHHSFASQGNVAELLPAARELNERLKDRLRMQRQEAHDRGVQLPALSDEVKCILHGMFQSSEDNGDSSALVPAVKKAPSMSLLKNASTEREPEDLLFHFPKAMGPSTSKGAKQTRSVCNQSTWTIEDSESDVMESQNSVEAVKRIRPQVRPLDPALSSLPLSRLELQKRGEGELRAHWFWHANLRPSEITCPSIVCSCSRSGILVRTFGDANRAQLKEQITLGDVKMITLAMTAASFRSWGEWEEAASKRGGPNNNDTTLATADDDSISCPPTSESFHDTRRNVVRRSLTISLKESRRSALFGMWHNELTLVFDTLDGYNAFLSSFLHWVSHVQCGVDAFSLLEPPLLQPAALLRAVEEHSASGNIKDEEAALCSRWHILPVDYLAAKERLLSPYAPVAMGIEDLFECAPALDIVQMLMMVQLFERRGWVALHTCYHCL